jgi:hypothetical protein
VAVFRAVALENESPAEVGARHGMTTNSVYQIKNRLLNRVRSIVAELERGTLQENNE